MFRMCYRNLLKMIPVWNREMDFLIGYWMYKPVKIYLFNICKTSFGGNIKTLYAN